MPPSALPAYRFDLEYEAAEALLAEGRLKEAAAKCQEMLNIDPHFAPGWFLFGKLYTQTGNHAKAVDLFTRAITHSPQPDAAFHYLRGNSRLLIEDLAGAREDFEMVIELTPGNDDATLLVASTCIRLGDRKTAHLWLDRAERLGRTFEALEQRGILLQEEGRLEEASAAFEKLLKERPDYPFAHVHHGNLRLMQNDAEGAKQDAVNALQLDMDCARAWLLKALAHSCLDEGPHAIFAAMQAVNKEPGILQSRHLLAATQLRNGDSISALDQYKQIIARWPDDTVALSQLPTLLMALGQIEEAQAYIARALEADPENVALRHFAAAAEGRVLATADPDYVSSLFDGYAAQFDHSLQEKLNYRIPQEAAAMLAESPGGKDGLALLDLGCGTGLGAVALEPFTTRRVGVDLSPRMLEKAGERKLYDEIYVADIGQFLDEFDERFDLVTALDVFVYIGDLAPLFEKIHAHLKPGGRFLFSVEREDGAAAGYHLRHTGRFAHDGAWLDRLASATGFTLLRKDETVVRMELGKPLDGYLYLLGA